MTLEEAQNETGLNFREVFYLGPSGLRISDMLLAYTSANEIAPKVLVEIGSGHGISSIILGCVAKKYGGMLYSVEFRVKPTWRCNLEKYGVSQHVSLIQGRSPWIDWTSLGFQRIDYLLIDGNHALFPVLADFYCWSALVRQGSRIAFHDYSNRRADVALAVELIEKTYKMKRLGLATGRGGLLVFEKLDKRPC